MSWHLGLYTADIVVGYLLTYWIQFDDILLDTPHHYAQVKEIIQEQSVYLIGFLEKDPGDFSGRLKNICSYFYEKILQLFLNVKIGSI